MKIFKVITERDRDGTLTKEPGRTSIEIERLEHYYAAECIQDVWDYVQYMRLDPDIGFVGILEAAPEIHVINEYNRLD